MPDSPSDPSSDRTAISRRKALVGALGAVAAGGALVATAGPGSAAPRSGARPVPSDAHPVYRRTRLGAPIGKVIPLVAPDGTRLLLEAVGDISDGRGGVADGHEYAFRLRFRQVSGAGLSQGTYTLRYPGIGPVRLFLAPIGPPARRWYEAVINRLIAG